MSHSGAYTESPGISTVRRHVAEYISERDGYPASPDDIFIGTGASACIKVSADLLSLFGIIKTIIMEIRLWHHFKTSM